MVSNMFPVVPGSRAGVGSFTEGKNIYNKARVRLWKVFFRGLKPAFFRAFWLPKKKLHVFYVHLRTTSESADDEFHDRIFFQVSWFNIFPATRNQNC